MWFTASDCNKNFGLQVSLDHKLFRLIKQFFLQSVERLQFILLVVLLRCADTLPLL